MDNNIFVMKDTLNMTFKMPDPPSSITLCSPDGRTATIDFGDAVAYFGDLPVGESAKIFFDAVFSYFGR